LEEVRLGAASVPRPSVFPVHNLGAGGNTPRYWEAHLSYPGYPRMNLVMVNAYFFLGRRPPRVPEVLGDVVAVADSGGYLFIADRAKMLASKRREARRREIGPRDQEEVLRVQKMLGVHAAFTLDYPLGPDLMRRPDEREVLRRLRVTAENAALALSEADGLPLLVPRPYLPPPRLPPLRREPLRPVRYEEVPPAVGQGHHVSQGVGHPGRPPPQEEVGVHHDQVHPGVPGVLQVGLPVPRRVPPGPQVVDREDGGPGH